MPQQCPNCWYPFWGSCWPTKSAVSLRFPKFSQYWRDASHKGVEKAPLPSSVPHFVTQNINALLSRSPHLMESLYKHFLQLLPVVPPSLDSVLGLGIISETGMMTSSLDLCVLISPLQNFSHKWTLVIRKKRNYTVGTQPICIEGLKSGQDHPNALVACFAWESGRKTILPYLPWLFGAVLASLHFCFLTWARPATFFIFSFWNPCRSFIPESLSLCLSHFPHVCVHTHIRRITSMLNGLKEWGVASLFLFFFSPSNLPEKLTILVSWLPSAFSWRSLVNGSFSCFDEIVMLYVCLFIYVIGLIQLYKTIQSDSLFLWFT